MFPARRAVLSLVLLVAVGCAGCGGSGEGDAGGAGGGTVARRPLASLVRYGGVDGGTTRVDVDSTGEAVVTSDQSPTPRVVVLSVTEFTSLRNALERSQIATLQRNYLDPRAEIDFQYDVTYQGVTVTTDAGVVPPKLQPVVEQLTRLLG